MIDDELLDWDKFGEYDKDAIPNRTVTYIDLRHGKKIFITFRNGTIWRAEERLKDVSSQ